MNKILLVDKSAGWTSFDVVAKIRGTLRKYYPNKKIRVGHAGTLDPFATGLLIILIGNATKEQDNYMKLDKEYLATLKLGYTSTTGDPEGIIKPETRDQRAETNTIQDIIEKFKGEIEQTPPAYSAIKVDGQRAYKLAREGKEVKLKPRNITIYELEIVSYIYPELKIRVKCSSGTYIRTLGEDIGKALGCGAYLTKLRRTKIGDYSIDDANSVEDALSQIQYSALTS